MNINSDFDLKKAKNFLLSEGYQEQGFESEDEMEDYYNDSDFIDEAEANTPEIPKDNDPNQIYVLSGKVGYFKVKNNKWELIGLRKPEGVTDKDIIIVKEAEELDEMAKIAGDLKSSIEAVLAANPDLQGLALKKAIKGDSAVINALDGEDLYDNQLNKFIALSRGEREVGQRGRKADPNKPAAAPKAEKSPKVKITNPKAAAKTAAPTSKLADLAPTSVFGGGEEDEEDMAAEKQAVAAAKGGKRLGSAAEKLAQVTKEMKALIPAYQAAKGTPEAEAIVAQLKALTAEKKALEAKAFK
jgi:hypothetical protein